MSSISVDYDVLNQKGSPAWYSDTFANIPTPGYKGRMFISTDTFAFYRDNGTGWDLVGGPGTGTITGAGVNGQVTYFIGTDTIGGNNNLFYDITNSRLGIGTATPGAPLDIHATGTAAQFNGTGVNNSFVLFQNAGSSKWRIGNLYNSGANDYQIFDVTNSTARLTIKNTGASTLIGTFTATSLIKSGGTNLQILLADGSTTPTSTFGAGSVTNVSALTLGTTGTDLTSSVANSTTTPVITLNVPTASATNRGALSSADWTTFNNKQATLSLTTTGTSGAATLVGATLNIPNYTNVGTVTSVAALTLGTTGTDLSSSVANSTSTPVITLNVPTASASNRGVLSSADWTTFNNKQGTISVTAPVVLTGATISMPAATTSVSGYLTSTDWNTFNSKTSNLGTVTDVVALTIGTTGIDITSTAVTTTTTPVITLNIPTASASNRGALSSTDWTTFNNKQATLSLTTTGTSGAATLVSNTLNIPNYGSALSGYLPLSGGTLTGTLGGTSASFSSSVTASGAKSQFIASGVSAGAGILLNTNLSGTERRNWFIGTEENIEGDFVIKCSTAAGGDALSGNTRFAILNTGNVGIGSSIPYGKFQVYSVATSPSLTVGTAAAAIISCTEGQELAITANGTAPYGINFQARNNNGGGPSGTSYPIIFNPLGGNVGIGTSSPNVLLEVKGGTAMTTLANSYTNAGFIHQYNSTNILSLGSNGSGMIIQGVNAGTNAAVQLLLQPFGGNVGIGTASPTSFGAGYTVLTIDGSSGGGAIDLMNATVRKMVIAVDNDGPKIETKVDGDPIKFKTNDGGTIATRLTIASTGAATFSSDLRADGTDFRFGGNYNPTLEAGRTAFNLNGSSNSMLSFSVAGTLKGYVYHNATNLNLWNSANGNIFLATDNTIRYTITSAGINNYTSRGNYLGATDNSLFSLNSGGTLYTVGFSPNATANSSTTLTLTTGQTTWIYTGTGTATWTLPTPSGTNQMFWIKNAGTGIITLNAFAGTNIINNAAASVSSITIAIGATALIQQDGNVKSYQLQ